MLSYDGYSGLLEGASCVTGGIVDIILFNDGFLNFICTLIHPRIGALIGLG